MWVSRQLQQLSTGYSTMKSKPANLRALPDIEKFARGFLENLNINMLHVYGDLLEEKGLIPQADFFHSLNPDVKKLDYDFDKLINHKNHCGVSFGINAWYIDRNTKYQYNHFCYHLTFPFIKLETRWRRSKDNYVFTPTINKKIPNTIILDLFYHFLRIYSMNPISAPFALVQEAIYSVTLFQE